MRAIFLTNSIAALKLTTSTCYWFSGDGSKITPKAFANRLNTRSGNDYCTISTTRFRLLITSPKYNYPPSTAVTIACGPMLQSALNLIWSKRAMQHTHDGFHNLKVLACQKSASKTPPRLRHLFPVRARERACYAQSFSGAPVIVGESIRKGLPGVGDQHKNATSHGKQGLATLRDRRIVGEELAAIHTCLPSPPASSAGRCRWISSRRI